MRQTFDVVKGSQSNPYQFKIQASPGLLPIINLLLIGSSMGLFLYVNSYFLVNISAVMDKSVFSSTSDTSASCHEYYCDQTAYNFMTYYQFYERCNEANCADIICDNYNCDDTDDYSANYYYSCQAKVCGPLDTFDPPSAVYSFYVMAIISIAFYGTGIVMGLVYGPVLAICGEGLSGFEKFSCVIMFVWPKLRYYAFRRREEWQGVYINFKAMVIIDNIINVCYGVPMGLYIYFASVGYLVSGVEIANFFVMLFAYAARIGMTGQNNYSFWVLTNKLDMNKLEEIGDQTER